MEWVSRAQCTSCGASRSAEALEHGLPQPQLAEHTPPEKPLWLVAVSPSVRNPARTSVTTTCRIVCKKISGLDTDRARDLLTSRKSRMTDPNGEQGPKDARW